MPRTSTAVISAAAAALALAGAAAASDTFTFIVNPGASFTTTLDAVAALSGTLRGDFDPVDNPAGTKSRTGTDFLFGSCTGDTNTTFPFTADGSVPVTSATTSPAGSFTLALDPEALTAVLTGLTLDMLNGSTPAFPVEASLTNPQSFRTCAPRALWPASTIPFDLGDATLDTLTAVQTATPAVGALVPVGPGQYTFATIVEVTITAAISFSGQPTTPEPTVVLVPVAFNLTVSGATATASLDVDTDVSFVTTKPIPGPVDQALPLPTIRPPRSTANFLVSTTLESSTTNLGVDGSGTADGVKTFSPADWNQDGVVNSTDVSDFINDWFTDQLKGTLVTDINDDGVANSTDVSDFINIWFEAVG